MKTSKLIFSLLLCIVCISAVGCKKSNTQGKTATADNSENAIDWAGIYSGVVPCADCEGIQTTVTLNQDLTYTLYQKYLGKGDSTYTQSGSFVWNKAGNEITLSGISDAASKFRVGENQLIQLDMDGNLITGVLADSYILPKVSDIVEKYWKLIEINGQEVKMGENQDKEAHFILKADQNRVHGNGGCNIFNGSYVIRYGKRISFSPMASTMMACMDMEVESQLFQVLDVVDNYTVYNDTLSLNKARMMPLARFVAVYF